jgi:hypothetical protein
MGARIIGVIALLSAFQLLQAQHAQANTVNITATVSGAAISEGLSFSFDNQPNAAQFLGSGEMQPGGQITNEVIAQFNPDGHTCTVPGEAPNAGTETALAGDAGVVRFKSSGDLLYTHATSGTGCVDFSSGTPPFPIFGSESGVFTGGTGKYAGATGSFTLTENGALLAVPALSGAGFGFFEADQRSVTGTLTVKTDAE